MVFQERGAEFPNAAGIEVPLCRVAEHLAAAAFGAEVAALRSPTRGCAKVAYARQAAMYLLRVGVGLPHEEIGRFFKRDRTTVAHACARVEDSRDDAVVDKTLECLEAALTAWRKGQCDKDTHR